MCNDCGSGIGSGRVSMMGTSSLRSCTERPDICSACGDTAGSMERNSEALATHSCRFEGLLTATSRTTTGAASIRVTTK